MPLSRVPKSPIALGDRAMVGLLLQFAQAQAEFSVVEAATLRARHRSVTERDYRGSNQAGSEDERERADPDKQVSGSLGQVYGHGTILMKNGSAFARSLLLVWIMPSPSPCALRRKP